MKKLCLIGLLFLIGCSDKPEKKDHNYLIETDNKCFIVKHKKNLFASVSTNLDAFDDSYGNRFIFSQGKITVGINDNQWETAASELKIDLSTCGWLK